MKSIWTVRYDNNEVKIENTWFNGCQLFINGNLQDEKFDLISADLTGHLINKKEEKENIEVNLSGIFKIGCQLFIADKEIEVKQEQ